MSVFTGNQRKERRIEKVCFQTTRFLLLKVAIIFLFKLLHVLCLLSFCQHYEIK